MPLKIVKEEELNDALLYDTENIKNLKEVKESVFKLFEDVGTKDVAYWEGFYVGVTEGIMLLPDIMLDPSRIDKAVLGAAIALKEALTLENVE